MWQARRDFLREKLKRQGMAAVLIDSPANLYYYTGFTGGEAVFLMRAEDGRGVLITDSRYYEQVEKECPDIPLAPLEKEPYHIVVSKLLGELVGEGVSDSAGVGANVKAHEEREVSGGAAAGGSVSGNVKAVVGIEATMPLSRYLRFRETCGEYEFILAQDAIQESRQVKDEKELSLIARAEAIGDAAFSHILELIRPGVTEAEIALELEFFMKRQGAAKLSFDTIVASGPNSSMPHAQVTDRKLQPGDFITMDFGCVYQGYCSDMTRTVALGKPSEEMRRIYEIVSEANCRAMEAVRTGVKCSFVDAAARDYIADMGYGEYFGHGLGHSVGLEIHEEPRFSPKCDVVTKENMVITDEPGIYLPGKFGVRIEDLLVVKEDGCECLSHSPKELIIL